MADAGDKEETSRALRQAWLVAQQGDLDGAAQILRPLADAGDGGAASQLADLLAKRGDLDELRARADLGDEEAASILARLLAARGDIAVADGHWTAAPGSARGSPG